MKNVMILTGAGQIGMAIARRMGAGMKVVIGDKSPQHAASVAETMNRAGFDAVPVEMDLSSRDSILALIDTARSCGEISMLVNAAGVSPSQASVETILRVDLYGTAVLLEEVGRVISRGGVGDRSPSRYLATACCSIPNRGSGRSLTATFGQLPSNRLHELSNHLIRGLFSCICLPLVQLRNYRQDSAIAPHGETKRQRVPLSSQQRKNHQS